MASRHSAWVLTTFGGVVAAGGLTAGAAAAGGRATVGAVVCAGMAIADEATPDSRTARSVIDDELNPFMHVSP
jgi:hypothetical protein